MTESLLARYLRESGETQHAFAVRIGVSDSALSSWVRGERGPDVTSAVSIARATEGAVPVESWVTDNDGRRHEPQKRTSRARKTTKQAS